MKNIKTILILFVTYVILQSCLVTACPRYHYFISTNNIEKDSVKVTIFSTPKYKSYVVTNTDLNAQVFIKSPIFENPDAFYLMQHQDFFGKEAKQFQITKKDGYYYRTYRYKNITLKVIERGSEKVINYEMIDR
jgi:hypothetical protein